MENLIIKSKKNKKLFNINNYVFEINKIQNEKLYCRCVLYYSNLCKSTCILTKEPPHLILKHLSIHNHPNNEEKIKKKLINEIYIHSVENNSNLSIPHIYNNVTNEIVLNSQENFQINEIAPFVPAYGDIKSVLYRKRANIRPPLPRNIESLILGGNWILTNNNLPFLMFDDRENKTLGFCTVDFFRILCEVDTVYMDGTFKTVPSLFLQLYTIHGFNRGLMIPLIYFLLPNKTIITYTQMFNLIIYKASNMGLIFYPNLFQIDFELSIITTIKTIFPNSRIKGCLFHFTQAVFRKIIELGLRSETSNIYFKYFYKGIGSLALTPLNLFDQVINILQTYLNMIENINPEKLNSFIFYLSNTWLASDALFSRNIWNHYLNFGPRTINHLEGFHYRLKKNIKEMHPNIYTFIEHIKNEQQKTETQQILLMHGGNLPALSNKYRKINDKIHNLWIQLQNNTITLQNFIENIGFFLHFEN